MDTENQVHDNGQPDDLVGGAGSTNSQFPLVNVDIDDLKTQKEELKQMDEPKQKSRIGIIYYTKSEYLSR